MDDDESIFDPSLKKKKKKKTGFNLDAALADGSTEPQLDSGDAGIDTETKDDAGDVDDSEMFGKKKTKKKKKAFNLDDLGENLPDSGEGGTEGEAHDDDELTFSTAGGGGGNEDDFDLDMDFSKAKKKKTKKKKVDLDDIIAEEGADGDDKENEGTTGLSWKDSDRDYTYDELLERAFTLLREKNPDMALGEKKKFVMKPPQVVRIGSKKTAFANFSEICRLLHRQPKHLLLFLLAELGTSGSIDGNSQLIIKGRFQQKQIENVLRRYIKEYVTCHTCKSPDTTLQKDARIYFLQCEQCNSRCSVTPIKSGFQAVANKQQRQAIRASKN